jgi:transketolase N-terminal domain/subunit
MRKEIIELVEVAGFQQTEETKDLKQNEALKFRHSSFGFRACCPYVDARELANQLIVTS